MAKILVSIAAAQANRYIKEKKPSDIIPFKGNFPLLENYKYDKYNDAIFHTEFVEDCPDWVQNVIKKGQRIFLIENGFKDYLRNNGISLITFSKMNNADKADELVRFMNTSSLTLDDLKIGD